jgi:2-keto-4-pentenoate hydratase/2-oxohepta-3-ene-1,7-dioic acid hydratase in catechol pathway
MKIYTVKKEGKELVAVKSTEREVLYPIGQFGLKYASVNELIEEGTEAEWQLLKQKAGEKAGEEYSFAEVELCSPIPRPRQDVVCLGINYAAHATEAARYKDEAFGGERPWPIYFAKRVNEAVADGGIIPAYEGLVDSLDYEAELGVIIGKDAKNVEEKDVYDYVLGYTVINDVSARNLQTRHKQWYFGKSLDGFTPIGPCIVTKDEFENPPVLGIRSYVNGELRQNSTTDLLITDIAHIVHELSQGMTLQAGTIIATGTPAGVGMGFQPPRFLKKGDVVICEIDGIGSVTNYIK